MRGMDSLDDAVIVGPASIAGRPCFVHVAADAEVCETVEALLAPFPSALDLLEADGKGPCEAHLTVVAEGDGLTLHRSRPKRLAEAGRSRVVVEEVSGAALLHTLVDEVDAIARNACARRLTGLPGAVVATDAGAVALLDAGADGSATRLAAALVAAGAAPVGDALVLLDDGGALVAHPRPLRLDVEASGNGAPAPPPGDGPEGWPAWAGEPVEGRVLMAPPDGGAPGTLAAVVLVGHAAEAPELAHGDAEAASAPTNGAAPGGATPSGATPSGAAPGDAAPGDAAPAGATPAGAAAGGGEHAALTTRVTPAVAAADVAETLKLVDAVSGSPHALERLRALLAGAPLLRAAPAGAPAEALAAELRAALAADGLARVEVGEPFDHEPGGPLEPAEGVVSVPVAGELLLHEQRTGGLHHLNPAAALLWACLLDGLDAEASAAELAAALGHDDAAAVAGEVAAFHAWVREAGLAVEPARA